jgi:hypothetical protein
MNWAKRYRNIKNNIKNSTNNVYISPDEHFDLYKRSLKELYDRLQNYVYGTMVQSKYHKVMIPKSSNKSSFMSEKAKVNSLILSDNDNELKIIPEGIHFIGVVGKVYFRAYQKVYTFNSVIEKRIKFSKEPYFFLVHDTEDKDNLVWGYLQDSYDTFPGYEIKKLTDDIIETLLDEVFLSV